jgi:hypothetical protein
MAAWSTRNSSWFTRGGRLFRPPYMYHLLHRHVRDKYDLRECDIYRCMGEPRLVSYSLDCYKTLPWTATIADRIDCWTPFHDVNTGSHGLFSGVSSVIWMLSSCFTEVPHVLDLLLWLPWDLSYCRQILWCVNPMTGICSWPLSHHFSAGFIIHRKWYLRRLGNRRGIAVVCAGTASDPRHSRISCWARGKGRRGNRHDVHCFPGW